MPKPSKKGLTSVEEAIFNRRSRREYLKEGITLKEISQLCWCCQGITDKKHKLRAAPSAGALYPLEIFIVLKDAEIEPGIYRYFPESHSIIQIKRGDFQKDLARVALGQTAIKNSAMSVVIAANFEKTEVKYGKRAERYVFMEAGHAAQNIYLQAESLNLGLVSIGAFYDEEVKKVLSLPKELIPLYIIPIGKIFNKILSSK